MVEALYHAQWLKELDRKIEWLLFSVDHFHRSRVLGLETSDTRVVVIVDRIFSVVLKPRNYGGFQSWTFCVGNIGAPA